METAILVIGACNLLAGIFLFITVVGLVRYVIAKEETTAAGKSEVKPTKAEISEEEKERIDRETKRRNDEWQNFLRYNGESQTKKGGD